MRNKKNLSEEIAELYKSQKEPSALKAHRLQTELSKLTTEEQIKTILEIGAMSGFENQPLNVNLHSGLSDLEIIAQDYIALSKYVIEKAGIRGATSLHAEINDGSFTVYALTPERVELDFSRYVLSDNQLMKEKLYEAEALRSDMFLEDGAQADLQKIIDIINTAVL